jgi:hypothetical protein
MLKFSIFFLFSNKQNSVKEKIESSIKMKIPKLNNLIHKQGCQGTMVGEKGQSYLYCYKGVNPGCQDDF